MSYFSGWHESYRMIKLCVCVPRAILSTLMILMMVGLMGREALLSISSSVMPITDRRTMARSNWFHLHTCTQTHTQGLLTQCPQYTFITLSAWRRKSGLTVPVAQAFMTAHIRVCVMLILLWILMLYINFVHNLHDSLPHLTWQKNAPHHLKACSCHEYLY